MRLPTLILTASLGLAAVSAAHASGSYVNRAPLPPAKAGQAKVDRAKYALGQKVFAGKAPAGAGDALSQQPRLTVLQGRLPSKVAAKNDLTRLAGKLTEEQLSALEYYVGQRYAK